MRMCMWCGGSRHYPLPGLCFVLLGPLPSPLRYCMYLHGRFSFRLASLTCRRKDENVATGERLTSTRKGRDEEGLAKIRGPEWGITELDFEGDYNAYQNQEMKREYDGAGKGLEPTAYRASHRAGQQSVSTQAWMQEVRTKNGCWLATFWRGRRASNAFSCIN